MLPLIIFLLWPQSQGPQFAPTGPQGPINLNGPGTTCSMSPMGTAILQRNGPFLAMISGSNLRCNIELYIPKPPSNSILVPPLYKSSSLEVLLPTVPIPLTPSGPQGPSPDKWCYAGNEPAYGVRLILPAAVIENRTQARFKAGTFDADPSQPVDVLPPMMGLVNVLGSNYPQWNRQDPACANKPSLTFAPNSLGTGQVRVSAQILVIL